MFRLFFHRSISTLRPVKYLPARPGIHVDARKYATSQATLKSAPLKKLRQRPQAEIRRIQTLDRNRLTSRDFVDLSNLTGSPIAMDSRRAYIRYGQFSKPDSERYGILTPRFPPNARGFLYYHQDPCLPHTAGEIRFRVTAGPDPALFEAGKDLRDLRGMPWSLHLLQLVNSTRRYHAFKEILVKDELLDPTFLLTIEKSWVGNNFRPSMRMLHYLEQPFDAILKSRSSVICLWVVTPHTFDKITTPPFLVDLRQNIRTRPYTGRLLLRFERSTLPQHAGSDFAVLRVLKVLEPFKVVIPDYDMSLPIPCEGELLQIRYHNNNRPFSVDLNNPPDLLKALRFFALERT